MEDLSWKDVFNSDHNNYGHIDKVFELVKQTGYHFFAFNDRVYQMIGDKSYIRTDLTVRDLR